MRDRNWAVGACVLACFGLVGCTGETTGIQPEELDEERRKTRAIQLQVDELEAKIRDAASAAADQLAAEKKKAKELSEQIEERDTTIEELKKEFTDYKSKYRASVRKKIIGTQIAVLETEKGVLRNITVKEVTAVGIRYTTDDGGGRLRFEDLNKELRMKLGYDEEEAARHLAEESKVQEAVASRGALAKKVRLEQQAETLKTMAKQDLAKKKASLAKLRLFLVSGENEARRLENEASGYDSKHRSARIYGKSSSWGARASAKRNEAARMRARVRAAQGQIADLEAHIASKEE